jgi:hypothetical protein
MNTEARTPLWLAALDAASGVATLHVGPLAIEVLVRPISPADATMAGTLLHDMARLLEQARALSAEDEDELAAATREAAAPTTEEVREQFAEWLSRAQRLARQHATEVRDLDSGEWMPLVWCDTEEEARAVEVPPDESQPACMPARRALMMSLITVTDLQCLLAAGLRPAHEVAGLLAPFPGRRASVRPPGHDGGVARGQTLDLPAGE